MEILLMQFQETMAHILQNDGIILKNWSWMKIEFSRKWHGPQIFLRFLACPKVTLLTTCETGNL